MRNDSGNFHGPRSISSVMGDYRRNSTNTGTPRFHRGIDIPADSGTPVYSIISDNGSNVHASPLNHYIRIGDYFYDHVNPCIDSGTPVVGINDDSINPDTIATIYDIGPNHLHFQIGPSVGPYYNPITYGDSLENYTDNTSPIIDTLEGIHYFVEGAETTSIRIELDSIIHNRKWLYGKTDIRVKVRDPDVDPVGTTPAGIYKAYYGIKTMVGDTIKDSLTTIEFDQVEPPINGLQTCLIYDTLLSRHAQSSTFRYWLTNPINVQHNVNDGYWNTKQKAGEPDSVDADSIEEAKFKDGYYIVLVKAFDIKGNKDSLIDTVHIDNFMPGVKKSFPLKDTTYSVVANKSTKLYLQFSEEMDTATLKISNIHISSLFDSHIYDIDSLSYYKDSSYLFIYMDTTFRPQDTVRLELDTMITDLAGKPIKDSTSEYKIDFVVGLKQITDNNIDDALASIYGDKIVWVHGNYDTSQNTFAGDIMEYDIKTGQTQMISNGTDHLFTRPYVYKNKVAYFYGGYYWTNAVLYYDGLGNTSIISHSSETRAGHSLQVGDSGIVWRGGNWGNSGYYYYDTTFVFFYKYSDMATHLLSEAIIAPQDPYTYVGSISIDGNEIAYDQFPTDSVSNGSERNIFEYNVGSGNKAQLTYYDPDKKIEYLNPDISNGHIAFQGRSGKSGRYPMYLFDGKDILTIDEAEDTYFAGPFLHRGHIIYLKWENYSAAGKDANMKIFPHIRANITEKSYNNYSDNLKNIYYKSLSKKSELSSKQIGNIEINSKIYKTRSSHNTNYVRYFDGKQTITIDQDTAYPPLMGGAIEILKPLTDTVTI